MSDDPSLDPETGATEAIALVAAIGPLFSGHSPMIVGAALADLLAMWLAGHVIPGDPDATEQLRRQMLLEHIVTVRKLIPANAAQIGADLMAQRAEGHS